MYLDFFGLDKEPFHITPDPDFLYLSPSHKEALATVLYGVQQQKGFIAVTGEVGTGKTTVLRAYMEEIEGKKLHAIYLFDPALTFEELLETMLHELGMEAEGRSTFARLQWLRYFLVEEYKKGYSVVLLVDEAQNMPVETMEKLRILSNLETTKDKLLQIVLIGQPELEEKLALHALRQLNQRIAVRTTIKQLSKPESEAYVEHRLAQAGGTPECCFTRGALRKIIRYADGNPRLLNIACDNTLIAAFGAQKRPATARVVDEVVADLKGRRAARPWLKQAAVAAAAIAVVGVFALLGPGLLDARTVTSEDAAVRQAPAPESAPEEVTATPAPGPVASLPEHPRAEVRSIAPEPGPVAKPAVEAAPTAVSPAERQVPAEPEPPAAQPEPAPATQRAEPAPVQQAAVPEPAPVEPAPEAIESVVAPEPAREQQAAAPAVESAPAEPAAEEALEEPAEAPEAAESVEEEAAPGPAPQMLARAASASAPPARSATAEPAEVEAAPEEAPAPPEPTLSDAIAEIPFSVMLPASQPRPKTAQSAAKPADVPDTAGMRRRVVHKGDSLIELLRQEYGEYNRVLLRGILAYNPRIHEADVIYYGESLVFPPIEDVKRAGRLAGASSGAAAQGQEGTEP